MSDAKRQRVSVNFGGFTAIVGIWSFWVLIWSPISLMSQVSRLAILALALVVADLWNTKGRIDKLRRRILFWVLFGFSIIWTIVGGLSALRQRFEHFVLFLIILAVLEVLFDIGLGLMLLGAGQGFYRQLKSQSKISRLTWYWRAGAMTACATAWLAFDRYRWTPAHLSPDVCWIVVTALAAVLIVGLAVTSPTLKLIRKNWKQLIGRLNNSRACRAGFALNYLAAVAMGVVAFVAITVVFPLQFWYLLLWPVVDIIGSITLRKGIMTGVKRLSVEVSR